MTAMGKSPHNLRNLAFLSILAVAFPCSQPAALAVSIHVFTGKNARAVPGGINRFFRACDREVSRILPKRSESRKTDYTIVAVDHKLLKSKCRIPRTPNNEFRTYIADDVEDLRAHPAMLAKFAALIVLKKVGAPAGTKYGKLPRWIAYGVLRRALNRSRSSPGTGIPVFPGARALVLSGSVSKLMSVIDNPPAPTDGPSFELAMEISEIALNAVVKLPKGKKLLEDMVNLSIKGASAADSFRFALKDAVTARTRASSFSTAFLGAGAGIYDEWLAEAVMRAAVNIFNPLDAAAAERMFSECSKVRYDTKPFTTPAGVERPSERRCCVLRDIADELPKMKNPEMVLAGKQRDLAMLMLMMPDALQNPLNRMRLALSLRLRDDPEAYKKAFLEAESDFYSALDEKQKMESFVEKTERSFVPPGTLYAPQLEEVAKEKTLRRRLCPKLQSFLDSNEKTNAR